MRVKACPAPSCSAAAEWPLPLCQRHWYRVPTPLRDAVWKASARGAESAEYSEAAQAAIEAAGRAPAALGGPTCA